jgi:hypothetical protein
VSRVEGNQLLSEPCEVVESTLDDPSEGLSSDPIYDVVFAEQSSLDLFRPD